MSTIENLKTAFAGESQANRKYTAFANKADNEGYPRVAKLFRAVAEAETVHALNHLNVLGEVGETADNIKTAIVGEVYEHETMYPDFIAGADQTGDDKAKRSFYIANEVEKIHADLYRKALAGLDNQVSGEESVDYYVCQVCGNTVENDPPGVCPICGAPKSRFMAVD